MASRSPVIVNHRVALMGTESRAAVGGLAVYAGTRPGVVVDQTEADTRRSEMAGLVGYAANRPGAEGGLWDADGPIAPTAARKAIESNEGAVCCTVITVPRELGPGTGLDCKEGWQALIRSEWPQAFSQVAGVPEHRVQFYAAFHLNSTENYHVHILTVDREGEWNRLLPKPAMERARRELTEKAMVPLLRESYLERDASRRAAVDAMRRIDPQRVYVDLPPDGHIEAAHLRRYHPDTARRLRDSVSDAIEHNKALKAAVEEHRKSLERCAGLKGLTDRAAEEYVSNGMDDLLLRMENAALRAIAPERSPEKRPEPKAGRASQNRAPRTAGNAPSGPAAARRRAQAAETEARACLSKKRLDGIGAKLRNREPLSARDLRGCPTFERALASAPVTVSRAVAAASSNARNRDLSDEAGRHAVRIAGSYIIAAADAAGAGGIVRPIVSAIKTLERMSGI